MRNLQKMGGIAALYEAAAYIVGMIGFLLVVDVSGVADPIQKVALIVENQTFLSILHLIVYVIWAVFLVFLVLALYDQLKDGAPALAQAATAFGLVWVVLVLASGTIYNIGMETVANLYVHDPAQAATVWMGIESVSDGLSGLELVGGMWVILLSWAALRSGDLSKALNYLGVLIGAAGIISVIPGLHDVVMIFGLGQIVWFIWLGIVMLRSQSQAVNEKSETLVPRHTTTN